MRMLVQPPLWQRYGWAKHLFLVLSNQCLSLRVGERNTGRMKGLGGVGRWICCPFLHNQQSLLDARARFQRSDRNPIETATTNKHAWQSLGMALRSRQPCRGEALLLSQAALNCTALLVQPKAVPRAGRSCSLLFSPPALTLNAPWCPLVGNKELPRVAGGHAAAVVASCGG